MLLFVTLFRESPRDVSPTISATEQWVGVVNVVSVSAIDMAVTGDPDVVDSDLSDDVVDVVDEVSDRRGRIAVSKNEPIDTGDTDDTSGRRNCLQLFISLVAPVGGEVTGIGMVGGDRIRRRLSGIESGASAGVRDIDNHVEPIELGDYLMTELAQRRVVGFAPTTKSIVGIGELQTPQPPTFPE